MARGKKARARDEWSDSTPMGPRPSRVPPLHASLTNPRSILPPGSDSEFSSGEIAPVVTTLFEDDEGEPTMVVAAPLLTPAECAAWIAWGEANGFSLEQHAQTRHSAHRDNGRIALPSEQIAQAIFERLTSAGVVPSVAEGRRACACNPLIRLYKYVEGQRFGRHVDQSNHLADGSVTLFTVLLYLNGDFEGGETVFYESHWADHVAYRFAPKMGSVLVHAHGDRCLTHEGAAVSRGTKYLLRTDVAYSR
ncbi:hypothetical protein AB1Y20_008656 [Prymnesium parvum]|uniref:Fe2OG dioxygenase domain-containing protein n=1 Tax=Prymnesium parvum TaxID=97485 RepID=A0AB34IQY4_PRYPA